MTDLFRPEPHALRRSIALVRPTKEDLAVSVAEWLGIGHPTMSNGSTVVSEVLPRIFTAVTGSDARAQNTYGMTGAILQALGVAYDPDSDTSEHRGKTGGGTVTARAFSKMLTALTGNPRCFVVRVESRRPTQFWERIDSGTFRAPLTQFRSLSLEDAGPGSLLLFYQSEGPGRTSLVGQAVAGDFSPRRLVERSIVLEDYRALSGPAPSLLIGLSRERTQAITEISSDTYVTMLNGNAR